MKKFNQLCSEALFITTVKPESDSAGPVTPTTCPCKKDNFSQAVDSFMGQQDGSEIQPTDGIGETGEIEGESEESTSSSDVELECTEDGLRVKFNGIEIVLPTDVVQQIKDHMAHEETETPSEETEEHTDSDSEAEDTEGTEGQTEESEEDEDDDDKKDEKEPFNFN
jgi:hypothetical protein